MHKSSIATTKDVKTSLRGNYLSFPDILAQAVSGIAPSATPGLLLPILFATAGNASWATLGFAAIALLLLTVQLNVFASRMSSPGALYVYAAEGLGPFAGIVAGWSLVIAYTVGAGACIVEMSLGGSAFLSQITGIEKGFTAYIIIGVIGLAIAWWFAHRDIKLSTRVSLGIEGTTVILTLLLITLYFIHKGTVIDPEQLQLKNVSFEQFHLGLVFAFFCFVGFESASALGAEARRPFVVIPRAMFASVVIVGIFFVVTGYAFVDAFHGAVPGLDKETAPFVALSHFVGVDTLGIILTAGLFVSFFAVTLAMINSSARVLYVLAHRGLFYTAARKVHHHNSTPHMAIAFVAITGLLMALIMMLCHIELLDIVTYLGTLSTFGYLFAYLLVAIGAPIYLKRRHELTWPHIVAAVLSFVLIMVALEGSVYPVPDWPLNILPYIFLILLAAGIGRFLYIRRKNPQQLQALEKELLHVADDVLPAN